MIMSAYLMELNVDDLAFVAGGKGKGGGRGKTWDQMTEQERKEFIENQPLIRAIRENPLELKPNEFERSLGIKDPKSSDVVNKVNSEAKVNSKNKASSK
jgi:hypothetical protein